MASDDGMFIFVQREWVGRRKIFELIRGSACEAPTLPTANLPCLPSMLSSSKCLPLLRELHW